MPHTGNRRRSSPIREVSGDAVLRRYLRGVKLVVEEADSAILAETLAASADRQLAASWLLHSEMHCAAGSHPEDINLSAVRAVLDAINLVDLTRGDMIAASTQTTPAFQRRDPSRHRN